MGAGNAAGDMSASIAKDLGANNTEVQTARLIGGIVGGNLVSKSLESDLLHVKAADYESKYVEVESPNNVGVQTKINGAEDYKSTGEQWCRYFREKYGNDNVEWKGATPAELARSWQGAGKYFGVDDYKNTTISSGTILYRGPYVLE